MKCDIYTAVAIQPEVKVVEKRSDIEKNLKRCLELIDVAPQTAPSAKEKYEGNWAPIKLISFPEFFIQGHEGHWPFEHYINEVLIEIPGEETRRLAEKAKEYNIYIAGCALERDKDWIDDGYFFNTHFIIAPNGEIIHKYRKITVATHYELAVSPHDVYDKFVAMYGDDLSAFLPVTDTEIGKIGTITCMDGHFPEPARALGIQGAEVILHPLLVEPMMSPPQEVWQMMNRMRAWENVCYVVAASWGALNGGLRQKTIAPGKSMIVNYNGVVTAYADYPGEAIISSIINLEELRRRRTDPSRNFPTLLRTEIYRKIYEKEIYPANQFSGFSPKNRQVRDPFKTIKRYIEEGIYPRPEKMPDYLK
ncbi:MAG TPA: nitrilase-related carbon-nitrogen hydrolase [Bacillota bacterium]|nr:nitrilase-related carbon-nitrogen hydrolase [Bacillota bacterium]